jgi:hypothetical protein
MGHEQDKFADFYRASRDSCLRAVTERRRFAPGAPVSAAQVVHASDRADGSDAIVIDGRAMPSGTG